MRFLHTHTGSFTWKDDPRAVKYAILSHVWSRDPDREDSYQDVLRVQSQVRTEREHFPSLSEDAVLSRLSPKVRNACVKARRDGLELVWVDSCCIDKSSSAELSEAINSMYAWYEAATICYAFLSDVSADEDPREKESSFRKSEWFARGWTLQELLAPAFVIFLSAKWVPIGTKHDLSDALQQCTGISKAYLTREEDFFQSSIGERMRWAAGRQTTRVEDEAYCLLGLFNVNIPTVYGEGRQAFQRLQQELATREPYVDTTLFAWGGVHDDACAKFPAEELATIQSFHNTSFLARFLFAASPRDFRRSVDASYTPTLDQTSVLQPYMPHQWPKEVCHQYLCTCV